MSISASLLDNVVNSAYSMQHLQHYRRKTAKWCIVLGLLRLYYIVPLIPHNKTECENI